MIIDNYSDASETSVLVCESASNETSAVRNEHELLESHLYLVSTAVARIKRSVPAHIDADDLYSIGLAGLVSAVRKFNPIQGRTFAGFAALRVRGAMLDELRRLDTCSRRARSRARQLKATAAELTQKLGREAKEEEIRAAIGLDRAEYNKWVEEAKPIGFTAIDRLADCTDGSGSSLHDLIADEQDETGRDQLEKSELVELLSERIGELPDLEQKILSMYYFEGVRIAEIAKAYGVTSSRISQVHTRALNKLREALSVARES